jgi:glycosyltransferase involved in cell wall biosynthesis
MAILESLANGCWIVTSSLGALPEQVQDNKNGFLISGNPYSKEYKEKFIEKSVESLTTLPTPNSTGLIFSWQEQVEKLRGYIEGFL